MSAYDYEHCVKDFIQRTKTNLQRIDEIAANENDVEAYEFTQLMNSLFGLLIVPFERFSNKKEAELKDKIGYSAILNLINSIDVHTTYDHDRDSKGKLRVYNFIRHLRNALAHLGNDGVLFLDKEDKLIGTIFCDHLDDEDKNLHEEFCVELDLDELRELVDNITKMYSAFNTEFNQQYAKKIFKKRKLLGKED